MEWQKGEPSEKKIDFREAEKDSGVKEPWR